MRREKKAFIFEITKSKQSFYRQHTAYERESRFVCVRVGIRLSVCCIIK